MGKTSPSVGVVGCAAGGLQSLRSGLVEPLIEHGCTASVVLTPAAHAWLLECDEIKELENATGLPVRSTPRLPNDESPHPPVDAFVVAPATANPVAKLALGIADNQALTVLCENVGTTSMVVFPRINAAHARQPAWNGHLELLRAAGVRLIYGDAVWPLYEPRTAPPVRDLPWRAILEAALALTR
ncbi:MAG: flavoprotein [Nocardioidaceae bacterium]